jgi:stage III sporulation protein AA
MGDVMKKSDNEDSKTKHKTRDVRTEILRLLPARIKNEVDENVEDWNSVREIRLRVNQNIVVKGGYSGLSGAYNRQLTGCGSRRLTKVTLTSQDISDVVECVCNHSVYAYEGDIANGFITAIGGHRVGLAGKSILEGNSIRTLRHISFVNIRVAHEVKNCSRKLLKYVVCGNQIKNTLIISPPGYGKTTVLRDLIRKISNMGFDVGVVDERSEIGACFKGKPQNDLGINTDVMDSCPKDRGIIMLVRSMAPQVIAVDELGGNEDFEAVKMAKYSGCSIIATLHGDVGTLSCKEYEDEIRYAEKNGIENIREEKCRIEYNRRFNDSIDRVYVDKHDERYGVFDVLVVLGGNLPGEVRAVFVKDSRGDYHNICKLYDGTCGRKEAFV